MAFLPVVSRELRRKIVGRSSHALATVMRQQLLYGPVTTCWLGAGTRAQSSKAAGSAPAAAVTLHPHTANIVDIVEQRRQALERYVETVGPLYPHFQAELPDAALVSAAQQPDPADAEDVAQQTISALQLKDCVKQSQQYAPGEADKHIRTRLAGRVLSKRAMGGNLLFYDVDTPDGKIQVVCNKKNFVGSHVAADEQDLTASTSKTDSSSDKHQGYNDQAPSALTKNLFKAVHGAIRKGDVIEVAGWPGKPKSGEFSIFATHTRLLSPCLVDIPDELKHPHLRATKRHMDLRINTDMAERLRVRSKVLSGLRRLLEAEGFLEVETPILCPQAGGANARPFLTHCHELDTPLTMRVAPELYLKELVVGGFDRVYELGKVFRNEGVDATHNPEFTSCEFYFAYADLKAMMDLTETLIRAIASSTCGGVAAYPLSTDQGEEKTVDIDFNLPFRRIDYVAEIESALGERLPTLPSTSSSDEEVTDALTRLLDVCQRHGIQTSSPYTLSSLVDHLFSHAVEHTLIQPTFVSGIPLFMSPLAKADPAEDSIASRCELYVAGKELANMYQELNDPEDQYLRFLQQGKDKQAGDVEAQPMDQSFVQALACGLPPTAGCGIGVDRLVMILTGSRHLRDVLAFPMVSAREPLIT